MFLSGLKLLVSFYLPFSKWVSLTAASCVGIISFLRWRAGLWTVAGSLHRRRRLGEKRLRPGPQRDVPEAEETIRVQEWEELRGEQEAKPLPVHQRRLLMVRRSVCFYCRLSLCGSVSVKSPDLFSSPTATTVTILTWTPRSVWGNRAPTKPWSPVWRERRTSCSQRGNNSRSFFNNENTPLLDAHTLLTASAGTGRSPATGVRGGSALSWRCRPSSGPAAWTPAPLHLPGPCLRSQTSTHRWADLSRPFNRLRLDFGFITAALCVSQRERLVLILVCAGAGVVVLIAVISAIFAVRRVVYRNRWAGHTCTPAHISHTRAADLCSVTSPSAGHQCTDSPTSGSRMMRMASHPISKAPPAATARPASRTQMTWDTFSTISILLWAHENCDFCTLADTFPSFFFLQDLIEWHMTHFNGCNKDSWSEAALKKDFVGLISDVWTGALTRIWTTSMKMY